MNKELFFKAIIKFLFGFLIVSFLLFVSAGTFNYWNGWLLLSLLFIPMLVVGIIMFFKNPELLKSRLNAKEEENDQKIVLLYSAIMFIVGFVLAGLNYRYKWFELDNIVVIISSVVFIFSYLIYAEILRENTYLSRTIGVKETQKVIDTGLYKIVRHPMYAITIILFLSMTLVLGSIFSFVVFLMYPLIITKRIVNEEMILKKELKGYKEYMKKVKYRIIPYIW